MGSPVRAALLTLVGSALALALVSGIGACTTSAAVTVTDAWVRATPPGAASSAGYAVISNLSANDDTLVGITTPSAAAVMLHDTSTDASGMTAMTSMSRLPLKAGSSVALVPGGRHLMLDGLRGGLTAGSIVELDLIFEHAGTVVVRAVVR